MTKLEVSAYGNVRLPSGMLLKPNDGIVGIDAELRTFGGYDSRLRMRIGEPNENIYILDDGPVDEHISKEDRVALAEEMIRRWTLWRDAA